MKKTLFAFSVTVVLSIAMFLAVGLSGCDWFNTAILGKPSKTELAEREKQRQEELNRLDSIRNAAAEKYANLESSNLNTTKSSTNTINNSSKPYHIIVSCYEEQVNVNNMIKILKDNGYNPYTLQIGHLTAVSAGSFNSESKALAEVKKIKEKDFTKEIDDEIWVYKK